MTLSAGPTVALVPLRSPGHGKTRLADVLDRDERAALSSAMLADVVAALRAGPVDRIVVAAAGRGAAGAARDLGVEVLVDPPAAPGLDAALAAAATSLPRRGTLLVVMADLPRLRPTDVTAVLAIGAPVVVAATTDGGTGGLLRRPPGVISTAYGRGSASHHCTLARRAGTPPYAVDLPGFRHDVDTWRDLSALRPEDVGPATAAFLTTQLKPADC